MILIYIFNSMIAWKTQPIRLLLSGYCLILLSACDASQRDVPVPSVREFSQSAYPILLRDCGFPACHGDESRPFAIFGPGRVRLDVDPSDSFAPPSDLEFWISYQRSRAMLLAPSDGALPPLLNKPLRGNAHEGSGRWKENIYTSDDQDYRDLQNWAFSTSTKVVEESDNDDTEDTTP